MGFIVFKYLFTKLTGRWLNQIYSVCLRIFFHGCIDIAKLSKATICLIFEVPNADLIIEFWPIGLLNCSYNFFSKVLTNILYFVLNKIIDEFQSAF
jgi:hypothetical protein